MTPPAVEGQPTPRCPALRTTARPRLERSYCRTAQKYGIVLKDTTPVHALTIYQEDVKDNPPATGNPFAGAYWATDADWPSLAKVPVDQFRVVAPFRARPNGPLRTSYGSDRARWLAARS